MDLAEFRSNLAAAAKIDMDFVEKTAGEVLGRQDEVGAQNDIGFQEVFVAFGVAVVEVSGL